MEGLSLKQLLKGVAFWELLTRDRLQPLEQIWEEIQMWLSLDKAHNNSNNFNFQKIPFLYKARLARDLLKKDIHELSEYLIIQNMVPIPIPTDKHVVVTID